jgi:ABC-type taurine transport system ATPase subunit
VTQRFAVPRENREFTAIQDISFEVRSGELVSIVGPSGCGKSTLLALVAGLSPATEGRITVDGQPVTGVNPRLTPSVVFAGVIETMRAFDAVPAGLKIEPESVYDNTWKFSRSTAHRRAGRRPACQTALPRDIVARGGPAAIRVTVEDC